MKMGRTAVATLGFVASLLVTMALTAGSSPNAMKGMGDHASMLQRGEHLTTVMSCNDCHTPGAMFGAPDMKRKLSGSELGWQGPWGVTYARNLTPDMETGIGKWSEQDIMKALRTGTRPDGSILQPPMPWTNFTTLTDDEAMAIAVYLKSLPPVAHKVPDRVAPGTAANGSIVVIPAPSAWDVPPPAQEAEKK